MQGIIEEEKIDSFNIPFYATSPREVKFEVEKEGSFIIDLLEVSEINCNACYDGFIDDSEAFDNLAKCIRSVTEPMLVRHFGESIMDEVFERYKKNITHGVSREKTVCINVTVSMTKKAL